MPLVRWKMVLAEQERLKTTPGTWAALQRPSRREEPPRILSRQVGRLQKKSKRQVEPLRMLGRHETLQRMSSTQEALHRSSKRQQRPKATPDK
jgi:hypothetical protein